MKINSARWAASLFLGLAVLVAGACEKPGKGLDLTLPESFSASGDVAMPARWWEAFDDPGLNAVVEEAMSDNLDLLSAWDRLDQARAYARIAGASSWPDLTATLGYSDQELMGDEDAEGYPAGVFGDDGRQTTFSASIIAGYELDLWGRVRSSRLAGKSDLAATREDLYAMAMTVSGEVARTWYELMEQRLQVAVLQEQVEVNQSYLELLQLRYRQGMSSAAEVLQQKQQVESTLGEIPMARMKEETLEHQLSLLLGKTPDHQTITEEPRLPELPPLPDTGIPAELLMRRPDLLAAQRRYEAAGYRVDEAFANRLPTISITLSASDVEEEFDSLFDNWARNLAANLVAPIFAGGRLKAEEDRARAVASERLHDLKKAALNALREVEDALAREVRQAEYLQSLDAQIEASQGALELSRERYRNGATDYLPVLINLQTLQRLERTRLAAGRTLIEYRIGLYRALAGGWELEREEEVLTPAEEKPPE